MNTNDVRDVVQRLDALESLTKLFKNLWFDQVKGEIQDEKIKAYLMVFDDVFPGIDKVVEFVRKNAEAMSSVEKVQEGFEVLAQTLLDREIETDLDFEDDFDPALIEEESFEGEEVEEDEEIEEGDLSIEEREALETVGQGDIDALFLEGDEGVADHEASDEEIKAFIAADGDDGISIEEEEEVDLGDLLGESEEAGGEDQETDLEDLLGNGEVDDENQMNLDDLLDDEKENPEEEEEEVDLDDLLGDGEDGEEEADAADLQGLLEEGEDDDEDGAGVDDLLGEDDTTLQTVLDEEDVADESEDGEEGVAGDDDLSAGISQEEMTALLGDNEEDQEPKVKAKPKAKAKKKPEEPDELEIEDAGNGEESISQDEIDALFG